MAFGGFKEKFEKTVEEPVNVVNKKTGTDWNPVETMNETISGSFTNPTNPFAGEQAAFKHAGGDISNAWKTSVNDPLNNAWNAAKAGAQGLWDKANAAWQDAYSGLQTPGGPGGGGGSPFIVGAPGMPGQGGVPGGAAMPQITGGMAIPANDPFRQGQLGLLTQLQGQAAGTGPSIAQNQLALGQEQALAQNIAMANSARGGANPLMARQAMQQNMQQSGAMANQAANLRLQEQQQAQQALAGLTGQGRQGDLGQQQLMQQGQVSQAQIAQAQNDLAAKYAAMGLDAQKANQQAMIDLQKMQQEGQLGFANLGLQSQIAQNAMLGNTLQGAAGAMAGLGTMFSDKRLKKNIKKGDEDVKEFLDGLTANTYEYKNQKHGKGEFTSPMAQDLLKSKIGRSMVVKTPEGLAVNYGANPGAILAAQAFIHKRLEKLENK